MVDADVEIAGVIAKGKLLTLTTSEALEHKVAELTADTVERGAGGRRIARRGGAPGDGRRWAEGLVRFLTNPIVSSLLDERGPSGTAGGDPDAGFRACRARSG